MRRRTASLLGGIAIAVATAAPLLPRVASANLLCNSVSISGVSPQTASIGATVTITGSGFSGCNPSVTVGGVGTSANAPDDSHATFTVKAGMDGLPSVSVSSVGGSAQATASQLFVVTPTVTGMSPSSAPEGGTVTVSGSGFQMGSVHPSVVATFCGTASPSATVTGDGTVSAVVPGHYCAGSVALTFTASQSGSQVVVPVSVPGSFTTAVTAPSGPGPVAEGGSFALAGSGFGTSQGTVARPSGWTVASWSDTRIVLAAPSADAIGGSFAVTRLDGKAIWSGTVQIASAITGISPSSAAVGDPVTVSGSGFGPSSSPGQVTVAGTPLSNCTWSHNSISCAVPAGMPPGAATLTVTPASSSNASGSSGALTIVPKVTGTNPTHAAAGNLFEIDGTSFGSQQGSVSVGGRSAQVTLWGDTSIVVQMPAGLGTGSATITVAVPGVPAVSGSVTVDPASGGGGSATLSTGSKPGSTAAASSSPGATPGFIPPSASGPIIASGPVDFKPQKQSGPVQLTLKPAVDSGDPGSDVPFTVTLSAFGKPVAGAAVDLLLVVVPGTDATISPTHAVTDVNGQVKGTLHLSRRSGDHIVLARSGQYSDEVRIVATGASDAAPAVATGRGSDGGAIAAATGSPQRMLIVAALVACLVLFLTGFVLNLATSPGGAAGGAAAGRRGPAAAVAGGARSALAIAQVGLAAAALAVGAVVSRLRR